MIREISSVVLVLILAAAGCGRSSESELAAGGGWKSTADFNDGTWVGTVDPATNKNNPVHSFELLANQPSLMISRPEYLLSWNPSTRVINWASWILENGNVGKTDRSGFKRDEELNDFLAKSDQQAVSPEEYEGSCFDRGHQVPSKDRTEKFAQNQAVFKMSNMMPQTAFLNRVIWERLEAYTRGILKAKPKTRIWAVAGPIYKSELRYMGRKKNIAIPDANFKIVVDLGYGNGTAPKLIASVIMPNVTSKGTDPVLDKETECFEERNLPSVADDWSKYEVEIEEIEKAADLDFSAVREMLGR